MMKHLLLVTLLSLSFHGMSQTTLPPSLIGNWIHAETNNWEIGFFENFAIYECDFWEYALLNNQKGQQTIELKKGEKTIILKVKVENDSTLKIAFNKKKAQTYRLMRKSYPDYPQAYNTPFPTPTFQQDSVTIIGYYRHYKDIPEMFKEKYQSRLFSISISNPITRKQDNYYAQMDSLGRFEIRFTVINSQEIYTDWQRLNKILVVQPGDRLFLFADANDLLPQKSDQGRDGYRKRSKQILVMGENARLNNELMQYNSPQLYVDISELGKELTNIQVLDTCKTVYDKREEQRKQYLSEHPKLSDRFKTYTQLSEQYNLASQLLQYYRFNRSSKQPKDPAFLQYISTHFPLTDELSYTLIRDFNTFLTDYIGCRVELKNLTPKEIFSEMDKIGILTDEGKRMQVLYSDFDKKTKETSPSAIDSLQKVYEQELKEINNFLRANTSAFLKIELRKNTEDTDSIITNPHLKELWTTQSYFRYMDNSREALTKTEISYFENRVKNPFLKQYILNASDNYANIASQTLAYPESLKNTDHLKNIADADTLWQKLIEPYKGKVIYVDFWGTWCSPCREQMRFAPAIKEKFKGEDVVFMYFANNSPQPSWEAIIKEMNLTGQNVVHYRLPGKQETILEKKLSVRAFPSYFLIDKNGEIINSQAPSPQEEKRLTKEIKDLL